PRLLESARGRRTIPRNPPKRFPACEREAPQGCTNTNPLEGSRIRPANVGPPTVLLRCGGTRRIARRDRRDRPRGRSPHAGPAGDGTTVLSRPDSRDGDRDPRDGPRGLRGPQVPGAAGPHGGTGIREDP